MNIIRYEMEKRKYSSNAITGVYLDEKGKEHQKVMLCFCSMSKENGDKYAKEIINHLNRNLK